MTPVLLREYISLVVEKIRSKKGVKGVFGSKFDLNRFKELPSSELMMQYAGSFLQKMGTGSSRVAFLLSSRYVLKVALNNKGIAQNQAEVDVYTNPRSKAIVAKVHSADPEYRWVMSDLVEPVKSEQEFEQLAGINWSLFCSDIEYFVRGKAAMKERIPPFVKAVVATAVQNHLLMGDINELDHWGKTPDGRIVLLDYGFTREVWASYYSDKVKPSKDSHNDRTKTSTKKPAAQTSGKRITEPDPTDRTPLAPTQLHKQR